MAKTQITIPIFVAHQGCPHQCAFCNQYKTSGYRAMPTPEGIQTTVERYRKHMLPGITRVELAFFGGSFTGIDPATQESLLHTALSLKQASLIDGIRLSTRPDYIDISTLERLVRYKVDTVELGIQSFHDEILLLSERGHTVQDSLQAINSLKEYGFNVIIQLMPGLPADSHEKSLQSARAAISLEPAGIRIYPTVVVKHTKLHTLYEQKQYAPLSLDQAVATCKEIYHACCSSRIPVIRMGIHPLKQDELHNIVAGPYHPAFGFKVKSRLKRDRMEAVLRSYLKDNPSPAHRVLHLVLPDTNKEEYIGSKKENITYLQDRFSFTCHYTISDKISEITVYSA
jgi:histone acetyltransferase (RNA polymerase elongator complex component)